MIPRPAWRIEDGRVISHIFTWQWLGGFSDAQRIRNFKAFYQAIEVEFGGNPLEISSCSDVELGKSLSAFNLEYQGYPLECVFQSSKEYEHGGPYTDLLGAEPKDSKRIQDIKSPVS